MSFRQSIWLLSVAAALVFALALVTANLSLAQSGDPDEGVYLSVARLLNRGYPYSSFFFDQFWLFPRILELGFRIGGDSVMTGRLIVVLFSTCGLLALASLAILLDAPFAAPLAILFAAASPYYLMQSRHTMTDVPSLVLMLWALVTMFVFTRRADSGRLWLVTSAACAAAGLLIKPLALAFGLPLGVWLISHRIVRRDERWEFHARVLLVDVVIFGLVAALTAAPFLSSFDLGREYARTIGFHFIEGQSYSPLEAERQAGLVAFIRENWGWFGLALYGAVATGWRNPLRVLPLVAGELVSVYILLQLPPWWHHYTLLAPLLALFAALGVVEGIKAFRRLWEWAAATARIRIASPDLNPKWDARTGVAFLSALVFLLALNVWFVELTSVARMDEHVLTRPIHNSDQLVGYLKREFKPMSFLISDDPMLLYRAGYLLPPSAINLTYVSTFGFDPKGLAQLQSAAREYNNAGFIVTGPYRNNDALMNWIEQAYPRKEELGGEEHSEYAQIFFARIANSGGSNHIPR